MFLTRTVLLPSILFFFSFFLPVHAAELEVVVSTQFDAATIVKGYTLESSDGLMRLGIRPNTLNVSTRVDIKTLDPLIMQDTFTQEPLGNIYLFDILNKESYDGTDFFFLEIKYPKSDVGGQMSEVGEQVSEMEETLHGRRRIYFFNGVSHAWEELPSTDNPETNSVRALIHLPYARLAIFEEEIPEVGEASWYGYKGCNCAASPDYPKGTSLLVTRLDDPTTFVTVVVNDYGPDRSIHPDRIIDLDKVAFAKLVSLGAGLIDVRVTLIP